MCVLKYSAARGYPEVPPFSAGTQCGLQVQPNCNIFIASEIVYASDELVHVGAEELLLLGTFSALLNTNPNDI